LRSRDDARSAGAGDAGGIERSVSSLTIVLAA
jgi:hypothetical protein